jgi:hypothetical protein
MASLRYDYYERDTTLAWLSAIGVGLIVGAVAFCAAFAILPPDETQQSGWLIGTATPLVRALNPWSGAWADYRASWSRHPEIWAGIVLRLRLVGGFTWIAAFFAFATMYTNHCGWHLSDGWRRNSGKRLALPPTGNRVAGRQLGRECRKDASDVWIAPGVRAAWERARALMLVGMPGSGKSQIAKFILQNWLANPRARFVILDAGKGDFVSEWPDEDFYLLAPHDDRGLPGPDGITQAMAWDIAADVPDFIAAGAFAERAIPEGDQPQWAQGARQLLQGLIVGLQQQHGQNWGWKELHQAITLPDADLKAWMDRFFPDASSFAALDGGGENATKTAASYITNFKAPILRIARPLALAWGDVPKSRRLSIKYWMLTDDHRPNRAAKKKGARTIILGRTAQMKDLSWGWISPVLQIMNALVQSPDLTENDPREPAETHRRLIFALDELPTVACKGDTTPDLVDVGRSKGVAVIVGVQSISQLRNSNVWGEDVTDSFESSTTQIVTRVGRTSTGKAGAQAIAENLVGWAEERKPLPPAKDGTQREPATRRRLVVDPDFFGSKIGVSKGLWKGARAAMILPDHLCIIDWPFSPWTPIRPAVIPARWISSIPADERKELRIGTPKATIEGEEREEEAPRRRLWPWLLATATLVACAAGGWWWWDQQQGQTASPAPRIAMVTSATPAPISDPMTGKRLGAFAPGTRVAVVNTYDNGTVDVLINIRGQERLARMAAETLTLEQ